MPRIETTRYYTKPESVPEEDFLYPSCSHIKQEDSPFICSGIDENNHPSFHNLQDEDIFASFEDFQQHSSYPRLRRAKQEITPSNHCVQDSEKKFIKKKRSIIKSVVIGVVTFLLIGYFLLYCFIQFKYDHPKAFVVPDFPHIVTREGEEYYATSILVFFHSPLEYPECVKTDLYLDNISQTVYAKLYSHPSINLHGYYYYDSDCSNIADIFIYEYSEYNTLYWTNPISIMEFLMNLFQMNFN